MMNKRKIVDSVVTCLSWAGLPVILRQFQQDEYCILMLHGLTDQLPREHSGIGNSEGINIHVSDFEQICLLLSENYNVVSLEHAVEAHLAKEPLPPKTVILTFDDGYESNFTMGLPILEKYELHGTLFAATDFIENKTWQWWDRLEYALGHSKQESLSYKFSEADSFSATLGSIEERRQAFLDLLPLVKKQRQEGVPKMIEEMEELLECSLATCEDPPKMYKPMNWDQVREMEESKWMSIGAHTHTHKILGRCQVETVREELVTCQDLLAEKAGVHDALFSYPNGHIGDHTRVTRRELIDLGFKCALTTETGFNSFDDDLFRLKRFSTGNSSRYVDVTASGTMRMLLAMNRAIRGVRERVA